uniref:Uncharacterized protein n=1 Tax=Anguilla anguilla TaxID=7936 RepID=A0A0E9SJY9_ANGAN
MGLIQYSLFQVKYFRTFLPVPILIIDKLNYFCSELFFYDHPFHEDM